MSVSDYSFERMKGAYRSGHYPGMMQGENVELLNLCVAIGAWVGFTFAFNKKPTYAKIIRFNPFTGRVFVQGGSGNAKWNDNFLLKQVKMFRYPNEVFEEWMKAKRRR